MPRNTADVLNDLISTCRDSQEGFSKAAKGVHADHLRRLFMDIFEERGQFAEQLQNQVRRLGGEAADGPHGSSPMRAGWVELETKIRPKDDPEFLANCLTGEQSTATHYDTALTSDLLDPDARALVERQAARIRATIEEIRSRQAEFQHA